MTENMAENLTQEPVQPAERSQARTWWAVGSGIAAVLIVVGVVIWHVAAAHGPGKPVLPARLLGVSKDTEPGVQARVDQFASQERSSSYGFLSAPVAAFYGGGQTGPAFALVAGAPCATQGGCVLGTGSQLAQQMRANGLPGARSFPPGPGGLAMVCVPRAAQGTQIIECIWADQTTAGEVTYQFGFASGLADAAAKTRQIRATIER